MQLRLPLAAVGAVLGLLISGISVGVTALLGGLMLIGIVVTNAIVLLDRVKQNEQLMIIHEAIVEAATTRMRPIFMTAVATICAMLSLLFKETETGSLVSASLAVVVIGGLSIATLLTLVVIPVVYELLHFKKSKRQRMKKITNDVTLTTKKPAVKAGFYIASQERFELPTDGLEGRCSIQLSYWDMVLYTL
jgi:Cu/Ag efflux pump CusA